jgi:SAM-dependent methyltransferase
MLEQLTAKLPGERPEAAARVQIVEGDMTDFSFDQPFSLIITPFRCFQHLLTVEQQLACLQCVQAALAPGGLFVLDVFRPDEKIIATNLTHGGRWRADLSCDLPDGGRLMRSALNIPDRDRQVIDVTLRYERYDAEGALVSTLLDRFAMRWLYRFEAEHLLDRAGFDIEQACGGYSGEPLDANAKEMVFICRRRGNQND